MLHFTRYAPRDAEDASPLVIVHGLFGSGRNWGAIAKRLAHKREVITVDQRNHGASPWADSHSYGDMAADLYELVDAIGGPVDMLGHSMGGKAAMRLALSKPETINRLIVADMAPVAYKHDQNQYVDAMKTLDLTGLSLRSEADKRLAHLVDDPQLRAFFLQSLDLQSSHPRWLLNLDVLEREMPKIIGWSEVQGAFDHASLFISGSNSSYVLPEYLKKIRQLFPKAAFAKINGAGHWLHAEKPREFIETVELFLSN